MKKLIDGLHTFQTQVFSTQEDLFQRLSKGQSPEALFITCADSRINPNLITQTEPGELFILRNIGNMVPPHGTTFGGESAAVEYALQALGVRDIIVCGHSHCGAMQALLKPEAVQTMPAVSQWLDLAANTRDLIRKNYSNLDEAHQLNVTIQENVLTQLENLKTIPIVAERLERGELSLHGWVYQFETGKVFAYKPTEGQFSPIHQTPTSETASLSPLVSSV
jgi:carbonic anhydrase